jgi:hypothetical protein
MRKAVRVESKRKATRWPLRVKVALAGLSGGSPWGDCKS